jgi:antitoxin (DNA-binding transcriptional repressor) of toxin-antitoxin stability system
MTMKKVNIFEAKARLSECIDAVQKGEQVVICRRNRPVAELRAITLARTRPRPLGGAKDLKIPESFFEPLPEDVVNAFYGDASRQASSRVAESPPSARQGSGARSRTQKRRG